MDSSGLGTLLAARRAVSERGSDLVVIAASAFVARVFEVTGIAELLYGSSSGGRTT